MQTETIQPSLGLLLRVWLLLSLQSFGGGVATLALIRQAVVERYPWIPEAEFTREWTLVQAAPGINLIAMTILIGKRLAGWRGIVICLVGLLLPSVTVTILLTAGYAQIQRLPLMQSALRGIVPATVGMGILTAYQMAKPPLAAARKEGTGSFVAYCVLFASCALAAMRWPGSVILILGAGGIMGALLHSLQQCAHPALMTEEPPLSTPKLPVNGDDAP